MSKWLQAPKGPFGWPGVSDSMDRMERAIALRHQVTHQLEEEEQRIAWETEWRARTKAEALQAKNSAQAEVPAPRSSV